MDFNKESKTIMKAYVICKTLEATNSTTDMTVNTEALHRYFNKVKAEYIIAYIEQLKEELIQSAERVERDVAWLELSHPEKKFAIEHQEVQEMYRGLISNIKAFLESIEKFDI